MTSPNSAFFKAVTEKANQSVPNMDITPINFNTRGDFNFIYDVKVNTFNENTYDYINSLATPSTDGDGSLQLSGVFSNIYSQVMTGIAYVLSQADQQRLNEAATNSAAQANALVTEYQTTFGEITEADITAAAAKVPSVSDAVSYVIDYKFMYVWSGREMKGESPLPTAQVLASRDINEQFPWIPASAQPLVNLLVNWLNVDEGVAPIRDSQSNGKWLLQQLRSNTQQPTSANGGMTLLSTQGTEAPGVGFDINVASQEILNGLRNEGQAINVNIAASKTSQSTLNVNVEGQGGGTLPLMDFLSLSASGGASYDMFSFHGAGESATVEVTYPGFVAVPMAPTDFDQSNGLGWYDASPIQQALKNGDADVTGFKFVTSPAVNLKRGGGFGRLTSLLISNYPTIKITYDKGDYNQVKQTFEQHTSWDVKFLWFSVGSGSESTYSSKLEQNSHSGGFSITLTPPANNLTVPDIQKTAYVIGGGVTYPAVEN